VERARGGEGPAFMLCHTYRYLGHHVGDISRSYYRSKEEETEWKSKRDPLKTLAVWLSENHMADAGIFDQIESQVRNEVSAALEFALNAPFPLPEEVTKDVYCELR
jgi:TPP-dependent pyruvate/acetoin dehydrogenase alpha subunit